CERGDPRDGVCRNCSRKWVCQLYGPGWRGRNFELSRLGLGAERRTCRDTARRGSDEVRRERGYGFRSMVFLLSGGSRRERAVTFAVRAGSAARITLGLRPGRRTARA